MQKLEVRLFGWPQITYRGQVLEEFRTAKVQELLCYLLLHRDRSISRETLASLICHGEGPTDRSKKYLRNALWKLRATLDDLKGFDSNDILSVHRDWIEMRTSPRLFLDVDVFERAAKSVAGIRGRDLTGPLVTSLEEAVAQYSDRLLCDWDLEWCAGERERLHDRYLRILDKLAEYNEEIGRLEVALTNCERILGWDRAHERTHQRIMRLYLSLGDRTRALRQYDYCRSALLEELEAHPGPSTVELFESIRTGSNHTRFQGRHSGGESDKATDTVHEGGDLEPRNPLSRSNAP